MGLVGWLSGLEHWLLFQKTREVESQHCGSKSSVVLVPWDPLFCPPQALHTDGAQTCMEARRSYTYTIKPKEKESSLVELWR